MAIHLKSQHITNMYTPIELVTTDFRNIYVPGGGVTDHGYLHGLADNDHPQYMQTSQSSIYITGTGNTNDFLGTDAAQSFIYTSDSSNFIASSDSSAFALSDHTHTLGSYITTAALSDHSHGSVSTVAVTGTAIQVASASNGLTLSVPNYQTTQSGVFPIAAYGTDGWVERWNGPMSFSNTNGITFGLNSAGNVMTAQMEYPEQVGILGIWDGASSLQTNSSLQFKNSNGISFGFNGSTMTASYTVPAATVFSNSNNVEFGLSGSTVTALANFSQTVQTENLHNITLAGNTSGTMTQISSGTMTLGGGTNITLSQNGNSVVIVGNNPLNVNVTGNTSGTIGAISSGNIYLAGGNNITLSQNGLSVTISGPNVGGAQTGISGIAGSNTTFTSGTVIWSGQNNITIGSFASSNSQYIRLSVGNYLTTAAASNHIHGSNVSTASTTGTNIKFTSASNGLTMGVPNYITTALTGSFAGIGFTTVSTSGTNIVGTLSTNGLNLGVPKYQSTGAYLTTAAGVSHTHGTGTVNGTNITGSISLQSNGMTLSLTALNTSHLYQTSQVGTLYFSNVPGLSWSSSVSGVSTTIYGVL